MLFRPRISLYLASVKHSHGPLSVCELQAPFKQVRLKAEAAALLLYPTRAAAAVQRDCGRRGDVPPRLWPNSKCCVGILVVIIPHYHASFSGMSSPMPPISTIPAGETSACSRSIWRYRHTDREGSFAPLRGNDDCVRVDKEKNARYDVMPRKEDDDDLLTVE